jgi:glycosyltransferase involved in cell wall biosynthesis
MSPPRVAIVSPNPSNQAGGVEWVCMLLAQMLERQGWQASIVGPARPPTQWEFRLGLSYPVLARSGMRAARAERPDLIVTNGYLGLDGRDGPPRVHIYHGTMVGVTKALKQALPRRERARRTLSAGATEALGGRTATSVVCVSEATADEVRRYYHVSADAIIPNGIDIDTFAPRDRTGARERLDLPPEGRYATFVGRFEHGKGAQPTVEAARRAGYELLIAGPKGAAGARHLGILAPERLADAYAAADCVVLPTLYEACSLVVLEALACERPLITTPVGWMNTLLQAVPEYRQLCVRPTVEDISARMEALADLSTASLTSAARAFVLEHNSLGRWAEQWEKLIDDVMSRHRR